MIESHAYRLSEDALEELPDQLKGRHTLLRLEETESLVTLLDSFDGRFHQAKIELHYSREQIRWVGSECALLTPPTHSAPPPSLRCGLPSGSLARGCRRAARDPTPARSRFLDATRDSAAGPRPT